MAGNKGLNNANKAKKDEFYTQLVDIEREMQHYREFFCNKVVFCNCDDPYESNFFKYFALNFNRLRLKKLISVSYASSPIVGKEMNLYEEQGKEWVISKNRAYKVVMSELKDVTGDGSEDLDDVKSIIKHRIRYLNGDGDFRSEECIRLLKEADVVVTNPPFSLFKEYVKQLIDYDKKFIIIGNQNAITYRDIFPLFKNNQLWLGYGFSGNAGFFKSPYEDIATATQHKEGLIRVSGVMWFTNVDTKKRHEEMILFRQYDAITYPSYDNYDAIEVSKTANIPCDYYGVMGVPVTFMTKFNPDQFELVGATESEGRGLSNGLWDEASGVPQALINGIKIYKRIFIRRK